MLRWALGFLVLALIAAFLGMMGVADIAMNIAWVLLLVFVVLLVVSLLMGRRAPPVT